MKIHIVFSFHDGAYGGGNQFLKALRECFIQKGVYSKDIKQADVLLFSSHHDYGLLLQSPAALQNKICIHRVDGPMRLYNRPGDYRDMLVNAANSILADGTVFQSNWSREQGLKMGLEKPFFEATLFNAPDPSCFFAGNRNLPEADNKIKLLAVSWSKNPNKGFAVYEWLDSHLDFDRFEMTFVGNSPVVFQHIRHHPPVNSALLGDLFRDHDIYITASINDPCSNALIEALHCGLPSLAINSGGHPEILGSGGEVFSRPEDLPMLLDRIIEKYQFYKNAIRLPVLDEVGSRYLDFCRHIYNAAVSGEYTVKRPSSEQLAVLCRMINNKDGHVGEASSLWKRAARRLTHYKWSNK